jgi:putative transposase
VSFFTDEISFLGFKLSANGILPLKDKIQVIKVFPTPKTIKQAQFFLGLANFYRRFIPNFSKIAIPITQFIYNEFKWTDQQEIAFATLKERLILPPLLAIPDISKNFVLTTIASHKCMGATLEQRNEDGSFAGVIGYFSKRFQGSQLNYSVQKEEFLTTIETLRQYRHLLIGKHFVLRTDHCSLIL